MPSPWFFLLPLAASAPLDAPAAEPVAELVAAEAVAEPAAAEPTSRTPVGYSWSVYDGDYNARLEIEAPIATVEAVMPLPVRLTNHGRKALRVNLCESQECVLPKGIDVLPGAVVDADVLFVGHAPHLQVFSYDSADAVGSPSSTTRRDCCDRGGGFGRVVGFAGTEEREFAFASHPDAVGAPNVLPVNTGTYFTERPDLLVGFGAVVLDDGWVPRSLCAQFESYVRGGGVLSIDAADLHQCAFMAAAPRVKETDALVDGVNIVRLSTTPREGEAGRPAPVLAPIDGIAVRVDDRPVRLEFVADDIAPVGAGTLVVRAHGRTEAQRLAQTLLADADLLASSPSFAVNDAPIVDVAGAALTPESHAALGFGVAALCLLGVGLAFFAGLRTSPVRAAQAALAVSLVGVGVIAAARFAVRDDRSVALELWTPGDGARRTIAVLGRAPSHIDDISLQNAPFAGQPMLARIVGRAAWNARPELVDGEVRAHLSSAAGLVGVWFGRDQTAGALRVVDAAHIKNDLPFDLHYVVFDVATRVYIVRDVKAGAVVDLRTAEEVPQHFGTVAEERFARTLISPNYAYSDLNQVDVVLHPESVVALAYRGDVLTAIQVTQ